MNLRLSGIFGTHDGFSGMVPWGNTKTVKTKLGSISCGVSYHDLTQDAGKKGERVVTQSFCRGAFY